MSTQKALLVDSFPGSFVMRERAIPTPGAGEVVVQIQSAALNPMEWKLAAAPWFVLKSFPDVPEEEKPLVLGTDFAGVVKSVGPDVSNLAAGDRVFGAGSLGLDDTQAFQQYAKVPCDVVGKIPDSISFDGASTLTVAFTTAAMGFYLNGAMTAPWDGGKGKYAGKPILILGGSSSVGQYAIQLANLSGFSPIITTASPSHTSFLNSLGATHVIPRTSSPADISKLSKTPIETVYDAIASAETTAIAAEVIAQTGKLFTTAPPSFPPKLPDNGKNVTVVTVFASPYLPENRSFAVGMFEALEGLLRDGSIRPNNAEVLEGGLRGVVGGLERMRQNQVSGVKLVARPQDTV